MNYGYPGANSQIENHNVSEESFWPSFTDIMMVIVMVFLLVTVAVILNNWALITKLTSSIEAQEAAIDLADNRREENIDLENKLTLVQENLLALNSQFTKEKAALEKTQEELVTAAEALSLKEESLSSIETKLSALNEKYENERERLSSTNEQLSESEKKLSNTDKELIEIKQQLSNKEAVIATLDKKLLSAEKLNKTTQKTLAETQAALAAEKKLFAESKQVITEIQTSFADLEKEKIAVNKDNEETITRLTNQIETIKTTSDTELSQLQSTIKEEQDKALVLEKDRASMDQKVADLLKSLNIAKQALVENERSASEEENQLLQKISTVQKESLLKDQTIEKNQAQRSELQAQFNDSLEEIKKLSAIVAESEKNAKTIEATIDKSNTSLKDFEESLAKAEQELLAKDKIIQELSQAQESGDSQLRSLQGEYDTLDSKYQKLLRPARSSQGKFVASVTYRQVNGKKVIRYKPSPEAAYRVVSDGQLANSLEALKQKHKDNLYIKVVIPEDSGLSYNEAWKFTIGLQRKYDYYYNDNE